MEMLLMGACLSVFGLAVAVWPSGRRRAMWANGAAAAPAVEKEAIRAAASPAHFLSFRRRSRWRRARRMPIEALLLQIENHVRLEHAAAECFLESPNASLLHSRTMSSLVN